MQPEKNITNIYSNIYPDSSVLSDNKPSKYFRILLSLLDLTVSCTAELGTMYSTNHVHDCHSLKEPHSSEEF